MHSQCDRDLRVGNYDALELAQGQYSWCCSGTHCDAPSTAPAALAAFLIQHRYMVCLGSNERRMERDSPRRR